MSDIQFYCEYCNQGIAADESMRGESVECPFCGEKITVPELSKSVVEEENSVYNLQNIDVERLEYKFTCKKCGAEVTATFTEQDHWVKCNACKSMLIAPMLPSEYARIIEKAIAKTKEERAKKLAPYRKLWSKIEYKFVVLRFGEVEYTLNNLLHNEGWTVVSQSTVFLSEKSNENGGGIGPFSVSYSTGTREEGIAVILKREKIEE